MTKTTAVKFWAEILAEKHQDLQGQLRAALTANGWALGATARALDVRPSTLQSLISTYGLTDEYAAHAHRPGRPRKGKSDA